MLPADCYKLKSILEKLIGEQFRKRHMKLNAMSGADFDRDFPGTWRC